MIESACQCVYSDRHWYAMHGTTEAQGHKRIFQLEGPSQAAALDFRLAAYGHSAEVLS